MNFGKDSENPEDVDVETKRTTFSAKETHRAYMRD